MTDLKDVLGSEPSHLCSMVLVRLPVIIFVVLGRGMRGTFLQSESLWITGFIFIITLSRRRMMRGRFGGGLRGLYMVSLI